MRVIETKPSVIHVMGKKKHKLRKGKSYDHGSDSSDDDSVSVLRCPHLSKAINQNIVKKTLKRVGSVGECTLCSEGGSKSAEHQRSKVGAGVEIVDDNDPLIEGAEPTIWICLQCGNQGCDRNSRHKHALQHYQTPRSACHCVVVNLSTWIIWCYTCDDEVSVTSSGKLQESVEYLRKQMGMTPRPDITFVPSGKKSEPLKTEVEEIVTECDKQKKVTKAGSGLMIVQRTGSFTSLPKVKGLNNLGNTCFFNAVMQNLSQTPILENLLRDHSKKGVELAVAGRHPATSDTSSDDSDSTGSSEEEGGHASKKLELEPLTISLPEAGPLTQSVMSFLRDMSSATKNTTISPSTLFGQVCKKAPRFKGFQQQDSHELLRHLLDGMRAEEIKRSQSALLKNYRLPENVNPKNVGGSVKARLKGYGRQVKHTFVDSVFGGYFISTVLCEECRVPSQILEPFLDISLPITEQKVQRPTHLWPGGKKLEQKNHKSAGDLAVPSELDDLLGTTVADQPSKHMLKKAKRQAKKESKRKNRGGQSNAAAAGNSVEDGDDDDEEDDAGQVQEEETDGQTLNITERVEAEDDEAETSDSMKANVDSNTHSDYDISDADIEDNLESDASRNRFQALDSQNTHNECSLASPDMKAGDAECSPAGGQCDGEEASLDSLCDATAASEAERTSISSATDSTVTLTEDTVVDNRTPSPSDIADIADITSISHQLESVHLNTNDKNSGVAEPGSPRCSNNSPLPSSPRTNKADCNNVAAAAASRAQHSRSELKQGLKTQAMQALGSRYVPASRECSIQSCLSQFTTPELLTGNNKFGCDNCSHKHSAKQGGEQGKNEMVYTNASKQVLLFSPPAVLTLHLKRFQQVGFRIRKVNHHVDFPMILDVAPNCSALCQGVKASQSKILYSLYGVVEHAGQMSAGHYTAYVKVRPNNTVSKIQTFLNNAELNNGTKKLDKLLEGIKALRDHSPGGTCAGATGGEGCEETVAPPPGKWYYISDSRVSEVINESNILQCQAYLLFYERIY